MANTTELSDRQRTIADFRFGIIADLVFSHLEKTELAKLIALKASQTWDIPFSRKKSITASCIRKWLQAFRACGKDGLVPKLRKDAGRCKVLSDTEKELIVQLLEKKPELCASTAVRMLEREGKLCKNISRSSLSRFLRSNGLGRAERRKSPVLEQVEPFAFQEPLECVQSGLGGKTPLEAWISGTKYIIRMEPGINLDEVFCHQYVRRVANDATVSLEGTQYEVPSVLIKEKVTLLTNPQAQVPSVRIVFDGKDYGTARRVDEYANARSRRMMADSEPAQASLRLSSAINPGDTL